MGHKKLIAFIILINYFQIKVLCFIDYNSVEIHHNLSSVILKNVDAKRNYMFKWLDFSDGHHTSQPQLVVSLPPQLRLRQVSSLPTQVKIEVTDTFASFRIREASLMHQGFYTAFKVINNSIDGNAYHFVDERRNFYINVIGLSKENEVCSEDTDCESNHCLNNSCVCNRDKPVLIDQNCYSALPIGADCSHTNQCKHSGGPHSVCNSKGRCKCSANGFTIKLPHHGKYCIKPKVLNEMCLYSEECQTIGSNRYCNEEFVCQCIPGYHYKEGIGCIEPTNSISGLMPSTCVWSPLLLLSLTFAAHISLNNN